MRPLRGLDGRISDVASEYFEASYRTRFVGSHQPTVTDDIGNEDSRQTPSHHLSALRL